MSEGTAPVVKIVGDMIVMSLLGARRPVVWRMELNRLNAAALEVDKLEDGCALKLVEQDGTWQEIAVFDDCGPATAVLALVTNELLSMPVAGSSVAQAPQDGVQDVAYVAGLPMVQSQVEATSGGCCGKLHGAFAAFTVFLVLIVVAMMLGPRPPVLGDVSRVAADSGASEGGVVAPQSGDAVSADDFLNNR